MGFSRQEYWSGVPLPSPNLSVHTGKRDTPDRERDTVKMSPDSQSHSRRNSTKLRGREAFPGGSVVKTPPADVEHVGSIPGSGRPLQEVHGNQPQHSCLGNPMD